MDMNESEVRDKENAAKQWKSEEFKAKEKILPYKYIPPAKRREFI